MIALSITKDFAVSISPESAATAIIDGITRETTRFLIDTAPGVLLDNHRVDCPSGTTITLIFAKFFRRISSFVTLVVSINNLGGQTNVHVSTGGHKMLEANSNDDCYASSDLIAKVEEALNAGSARLRFKPNRTRLVVPHDRQKGGCSCQD